METPAKPIWKARTIPKEALDRLRSVSECGVNGLKNIDKEILKLSSPDVVKQAELSITRIHLIRNDLQTELKNVLATIWPPRDQDFIRKKLEVAHVNNRQNSRIAMRETLEEKMDEEIVERVVFDIVDHIRTMLTIATVVNEASASQTFTDQPGGADTQLSEKLSTPVKDRLDSLAQDGERVWQCMEGLLDDVCMEHKRNTPSRKNLMVSSMQTMHHGFIRKLRVHVWILTNKLAGNKQLLLEKLMQKVFDEFDSAQIEDPTELRKHIEKDWQERGKKVPPEIFDTLLDFYVDHWCSVLRIKKVASRNDIDTLLDDMNE